MYFWAKFEMTRLNWKVEDCSSNISEGWEEMGVLLSTPLFCSSSSAHYGTDFNAKCTAPCFRIWADNKRLHTWKLPLSLDTKYILSAPPKCLLLLSSLENIPLLLPPSPFSQLSYYTNLTILCIKPLNF